MFKQIDLELYQFFVFDHKDSNIFFKLHFLNKGFNTKNIVYDWLRKIIMEKLTKIEEGINGLGYKYVKYFVNDKKHNESGSAEIWYWKNGNKKKKNGTLMINYIVKKVQQKFCTMKVEINIQNVGTLIVNYIMKKVQHKFGTMKVEINGQNIGILIIYYIMKKVQQ
jgi:hypothetical protein